MTRRKKGNVIGFDPLAWMKAAPATSPVSAKPAATVTGECPPEPAPSPAAIPTVTPTKTAKAVEIDLGSGLTIEHARALHETLARVLDQPHVVLRAGALVQVDTAGVQLLAAFAQELERRGGRLEWREAPANLVRSAQSLDLARGLMLAG